MLRLKSRKERRRRSNRRLRTEQLERRMLLTATGFGGVHMVFNTTLESLDLSGGPFPMPLANAASIVDDTGDGGPASVDGYGFVKSNVTVTLSSQREVDPGPDTIGRADAFLAREEAAGGDGGENGENGGENPEDCPINPEELDGQEFFVDSFFDVFFDITVTDVDEREGRDFAGPGGTTLPDGSSITLEDQGPGFLESLYFATFDKDVPNFGLVPPPPEASRPYVGHFDIAIPLPDVNGNGEPDFLKFQLVSHLAGAATYITLPDGTVVDEFDSTASILGAVSDDLVDPPFTIGSVIDPVACAAGGSFAGAPDPCTPDGSGLSGPTTATSTLLNPVIKDPGFSYVDANDDKMFTPGVDVALVAGELDDGVFDTDVAEGGYFPAIDDAGLVINGPAITTQNMNYSADADLTINTDLTARQRRGTLALHSRSGDVLFDDPTVTTSGDLIITAPAGDVISEDDRLLAISAGSRVDIDASGEIVLRGTEVVAGKEIEMDAGIEIRMRDSAVGTTTLTATLSGIGKIDLNAPDVELILVDATARKDIVITGEVVEIISSDLTANGTSVAAIDMQGLIAVDIADSTLTARKAVEVEAGLIDLGSSTVEAVGGGATSVELNSDTDVRMTDTTVSASQRVNVAAGSSILTSGATSLQADTTSDATVSLEALDDILADGISVQARLKVEMDAGGILDADGAELNAVSPSSGEIDLDALDDVLLTGADLHAGRIIEVESLAGNIAANGSEMLACNSPTSVVTLLAAGDVLLVGATIRAAALIDITGGALVDVRGSSIGIWRLGSGDISITGDTINRDGATLKAPGDLSLLATTAVIGTALDDTPGILPCP